MSHAFEHDGEALADADADRGHAPAQTVAAQNLGARAEQAASGCPEWVPDGDCAAAGVDDAGVHLPAVDTGQGLDSKGLVELDRADLLPSDSGAPQGPVSGLGGA